MSYLETTENVYREAAENPMEGLCCTTTPMWKLPGLEIPLKMQQMNYGCGTTVHPSDLNNEPNILYVGVGGGMELLQFSYFSRKKGGVIGIDPVPEMLEACQQNLQEAEKWNAWFENSMIELKKGNALDLPQEDSSVDVMAQNCLFNIFKKDDLKTALKESYRVLKPRGRLVLSDPVCEEEIPSHLREDDRLRALCLSGALPLHEYLQMISEVGFGTIEVRAKRPYRILSNKEFAIADPIFIESVEIAAIKDPIPEDGPCIFTGKTAIYWGQKEYFDDGAGHVLMKNQPLSVCDKTAGNLEVLKDPNIRITESTFFYQGDGCC